MEEIGEAVEAAHASFKKHRTAHMVLQDAMLQATEAGNVARADYDRVRLLHAQLGALTIGMFKRRN